MSSQERSRLVRRTVLTHDDKRWLRALPRERTQDGACPNRRSPERSTSRSRANGVQTPSGSRPIVVLAFLKGYPCAGRGSPSAPPAGTIGRWRRVPGTRFPVSVIIVGVPGLSGVASKMSTRSLPSSASPCRREAYDGRSIDPLSRPSYIPCANRGRSGSQLEDGSAWEGSMKLTRRYLLRGGIMLGGGAALIPTRRWFVVLSLTFALASLAHAAPGDPRLVQGVLEWPTTLTAKPFVVIPTEDRRGYYADIQGARRLEPARLTVGARVAGLGTEAARSHEITALAFGSGDAAALALAGGGTSFVIKDPATGQFFRFRANSPTVSDLALPMRSRSAWGRAFRRRRVLG